MSAFYFVAVAIIFTVCISILCLIFVPKILATKKPPVEILRTLGRFGGRQISRAQSDGVSESESDGIKILSTPVAIAQLEEENRQLEEENRKLKNFVIGSGQRLSSVLLDLDPEGNQNHTCQIVQRLNRSLLLLQKGKSR